MRFSRLQRNGMLSFNKITHAKIAATKFRKKLFCIDGRSPAIRTNRFMSAKQNADTTMYKIPLYFLFIKLLHLFSYFFNIHCFPPFLLIYVSFDILIFVFLLITVDFKRTNKTRIYKIGYNVL